MFAAFPLGRFEIIQSQSNQIFIFHVSMQSYCYDNIDSPRHQFNQIQHKDRNKTIFIFVKGN